MNELEEARIQNLEDRLTALETSQKNVTDDVDWLKEQLEKLSGLSDALQSWSRKLSGIFSRL